MKGNRELQQISFLCNDLSQYIYNRLTRGKYYTVEDVDSKVPMGYTEEHIRNLLDKMVDIGLAEKKNTTVIKNGRTVYTYRVIS